MCNLYAQIASQDRLRHVLDAVVEDDDEVIEDAEVVDEEAPTS